MAHNEFTDGRNINKAEEEWSGGVEFGPQSNMQALVRSLLSEADRIDDDLEDILESSHIDTASGDELDKFGALVQLDRLSAEPDGKYRIRIKAELAQARTQTDYDDFVEFCGAVLGTNTDNIGISTNYEALPAVVTLRAQKEVFDDVQLTDEEAVDIIDGGIPAGHEVQIQTAGTFFVKADGDADTAENGLTSDSISTGGALAADLL